MRGTCVVFFLCFTTRQRPRTTSATTKTQLSTIKTAASIGTTSWIWGWSWSWIRMTTRWRCYIEWWWRAILIKSNIQYNVLPNIIPWTRIPKIAGESWWRRAATIIKSNILPNHIPWRRIPQIVGGRRWRRAATIINSNIQSNIQSNNIPWRRIPQIAGGGRRRRAATIIKPNIHSNNQSYILPFIRKILSR